MEPNRCNEATISDIVQGTKGTLVLIRELVDKKIYVVLRRSMYEGAQPASANIIQNLICKSKLSSSFDTKPVVIHKVL